MILKEIKNKKATLIKNQIKSSGADKVKVYQLSTGSNVIYSVTNGKEHISISNAKMIIIEELEFVKNKLMKKDVKVKFILPEEIISINRSYYTAHIIEDNKSIVYN